MDYADEATDYDPDRQYPAVNDGHLLTPAMKSKTALVEYRQKVKPRGIRIDIGHAGIDFCDIFGEVFVDLRCSCESNSLFTSIWSLRRDGL